MYQGAIHFPGGGIRTGLVWRKISDTRAAAPRLGLSCTAELRVHYASGPSDKIELTSTRVKVCPFSSQFAQA